MKKLTFALITLFLAATILIADPNHQNSGQSSRGSQGQSNSQSQRDKGGYGNQGNFGGTNGYGNNSWGPGSMMGNNGFGNMGGYGGGSFGFGDRWSSGSRGFAGRGGIRGLNYRMLDLTDEQAKEFEEIESDFRKTEIKRDAQEKVTSIDLQTALQNEDFAEAKKLAKKLSELQEEELLNSIKEQEQISSLLTDEQKKELQSNRFRRFNDDDDYDDDDYEDDVD